MVLHLIFQKFYICFLNNCFKSIDFVEENTFSAAPTCCSQSHNSKLWSLGALGLYP